MFSNMRKTVKMDRGFEKEQSSMRNCSFFVNSNKNKSFLSTVMWKENQNPHNNLLTFAYLFGFNYDIIILELFAVGGWQREKTLFKEEET